MTKLFTRDRDFYRSLLLLSLPIALQNLVTFAVGLLDNLMIGALGDAAVSGVYMGTQVQTLLQVFSGGIEGAILILAAQYWGKRDTAAISKIVAIGTRISMLFGALVSLICLLFPSSVISLFTTDAAVIETGADYLGTVAYSYLFFCLTQALIAAMRSVETARIGLYVSLVSLGVNGILNYILIFGKLGAPALGVRGAAIATVIARVAESAIIVIYVLFFDKKLRFRLSSLFHTDKALRRDLIKYGAPVLAGQLVWAVNMLAGAAILGRFAKEVVTGVSIANTLNNLAYVVMNGMAGAVGILTGKTVGEGKCEKMREYARTVQIIFLLLGLLTGGALCLLRVPFISLYAVSAEAAAYASQFVHILSITVIGTCYQCACLFGLVKSGGDVTFVLKNDAFFVFLIVLPSALLSLLLGAPPWVVFACLKCDQILKCFVAVVKINRYDWMKDLTAPAQSGGGTIK